ncbi:MAG: c-type cytochrome [Methylacidiphilales bacterium]|nr:c-type cytochrome [Candidatus Methylacidiphilales bacterium]
MVYKQFKVTILCLSAIVLVSSTNLFAEESIASGKVIFETCKGCHSIKGYQSTYPSYHVPYLYGQNQTYITTALRGYRDGARKHGSMVFNAGSLSDQDIQNVAVFLSSGNSPASTNPPNNKIASVRGKELYQATCLSCHGENGVTQMENTPHLAGQYKDYLRNAIQSYKSGIRNNAIMATFVSQLTDKDIEDISLYLSSLSGPLTTAPR